MLASRPATSPVLPKLWSRTLLPRSVGPPTPNVHFLFTSNLVESTTTNLGEPPSLSGLSVLVRRRSGVRISPAAPEIKYLAEIRQFSLVKMNQERAFDLLYPGR